MIPGTVDGPNTEQVPLDDCCLNDLAMGTLSEPSACVKTDKFQPDVFEYEYTDLTGDLECFRSGFLVEVYNTEDP